MPILNFWMWIALSWYGISLFWYGGLSDGNGFQEGAEADAGHRRGQHRYTVGAGLVQPDCGQYLGFSYSRCVHHCHVVSLCVWVFVCAQVCVCVCACVRVCTRAHACVCLYLLDKNLDFNIILDASIYTSILLVLLHHSVL